MGDQFDKAYLKTSPTVMALAIIKGVQKKKFRILAGEMIFLTYFGILLLPFKMMMKMIVKDYENKGVAEAMRETLISYK